MRMSADGRQEGGQTEEYIPDRSFPCLLVREPALVSLKAGEPDGHLWNDTG